MADGVIVERVLVNRLMKRKVTFWFGMYVFQSIGERHDIAYEEFGTIDDEQFMVECLYFACEYGAIKNGTARLSEKTMRKVYELMPQKQLQRVVDCMLRSKVGGDTIIGLLSKGENKKKQQPVK